MDRCTWLGVKKQARAKWPVWSQRGIYAAFRVFKLSGSIGSDSRGISKGGTKVRNKILPVWGRMVRVPYSVCVGA